MRSVAPCLPGQRCGSGNPARVPSESLDDRDAGGRGAAVLGDVSYREGAEPRRRREARCVVRARHLVGGCVRQTDHAQRCAALSRRLLERCGGRHGSSAAGQYQCLHAALVQLGRNPCRFLGRDAAGARPDSGTRRAHDAFEGGRRHRGELGPILREQPVRAMPGAPNLDRLPFIARRVDQSRQAGVQRRARVAAVRNK